MKYFLALGAIALAACTTEPVETRSGVGFGDWDEYRARQQAELAAATTSPVPAPLVVGDETSGNVTTTSSSSEAPLSAIPADAATAANDFEANASRYALVPAAAVPKRPGTNEPNIVAYALATNNPVGVAVYPRSETSQSRFDSACARYGSTDAAQIDFLKSGGPEADRKGIDPDGDGFACFWDPTPFRKTRG